MLKLSAHLAIVGSLLFLLFPAEYVRLFSEKFPIEALDRQALKLTGTYAQSGVRYDCDNHVFFGFRYPFGDRVPGISANELKKQLVGGAKLSYFFVSDVDFHLSIGRANGEIEQYNAMVLAKCDKT